MNRATSATGWVRNPDGTLGWTWNPITGCLNHVNGMCKGGNFPCYAYRLAHGRLKQRYLANTNIPEYIRRPTSSTWRGFEQGFQNVEDALGDPFYPRFWEDKLEQITSRQKPRGVFVCDMADLFGKGIPERWTWKTINLMTYASQHRFYLLTKQPQNLTKFSPFPDNCWVGVTATGSTYLHDAIYVLRDIKARVKYISFEPLLGRVSLPCLIGNALEVTDWVIIGAQTKPYKPPKIEWVQEIVEAADKAGMKVFLKDNLKPLLEEHRAEWAFDIMKDYSMYLRQEMPE